MFIDSPFTGNACNIAARDAGKINVLEGFTVNNIKKGSNDPNATYKSIKKLANAMSSGEDFNYKNDAKILFSKEISLQYASKT